MRGGVPRRPEGPCSGALRTQVAWGSPSEASVDRGPHCQVLGIPQGGGGGGRIPPWLNSVLGAREEQWAPAELEPSPTQCLKPLPLSPNPAHSLRAG